MSAAAEVAAPPPAPEAEILFELDDIHAGYEQFKALFGVSLTVRRGQATALIGSNGAGKTTVARVASGLVTPTSGTMRLDGNDITGKKTYELARLGISHAPEGRSVFSSLTVEENLALSFRQAKGASGLKGALDQSYALFPRLGERRRQNAGSLSGGEQRMLTLARVLVLEPRLLIADELSLGLAPIITTEVYVVLERILETGTSLLVVEQHLDHALGVAHEVVALERGEVAFRGRPDQLDTSANFFFSADESSNTENAGNGN
jgi:branched-chain amino acid transport system ATP-binding protein